MLNHAAISPLTTPRSGTRSQRGATWSRQLVSSGLYADGLSVRFLISSHAGAKEPTVTVDLRGSVQSPVISFDFSVVSHASASAFVRKPRFSTMRLLGETYRARQSVPCLTES